MVRTVKGNLFDAPKGSVLAHACNTKGVWGSGVAAQFAKRFPKANSQYVKHCEMWGANLHGSCLLLEDKGYWIACLFTSKDFGQHVDNKEDILDATETAMDELRTELYELKIFPRVHMPKINSGLFRVPWRRTKKVLKKIEDLEIIVWSLD